MIPALAGADESSRNAAFSEAARTRSVTVTRQWVMGQTRVRSALERADWVIEENSRELELVAL